MNILRIGAVLGFLGVALGAFGAHALKDRLSPAALQIWNTAVLYHLLHAVALLALGLYARTAGGADVKTAAGLFLAGVAVFSGSLYALALSGIKPLGAVTPIGGLCFLAGWAWLAVKNT
jgi:uncharacterized membrane protein YgdD (TMEM256/DUF423 family)